MLSQSRAAIIAAVALALTSQAATAQSAPGAGQAIAARKAGFNEIGKAAKMVTIGARSAAPDVRMLTAQAQKVAALSRSIRVWFPRGSGPETGMDTKATAEIWRQPAQFARAGGALQTAADQALGALRAKNLAGFKAQWAVVASSCKSCHDQFRSN